nr:MAG TPA: hypothetical protein [Caudoviricetes sp.]
MAIFLSIVSIIINIFILIRAYKSYKEGMDWRIRK